MELVVPAAERSEQREEGEEDGGRHGERWRAQRLAQEKEGSVAKRGGHQGALVPIIDDVEGARRRGEFGPARPGRTFGFLAQLAPSSAAALASRFLLPLFMLAFRASLKRACNTTALCRGLSTSAPARARNAYPFPKHAHPTPHDIFHLSPGASQAEIKQRCPPPVSLSTKSSRLMYWTQTSSS